MVLTESDRYLIRALREEKKMSLNQILKEFPGRHWKKSTVADFLKRLKATGSIERRPGSGRKRKVGSPEKVKIVQKLICSKDSATGKNMSIRKIASLTGVSRTMVSNIASNDLGMKPTKKKVTVQARMKQRAVRETRVELCRNLLKRFNNKESLKTVWFSGERRFSVEKPNQILRNESEQDDDEVSKEKKDAEKNQKSSSEEEAECVTASKNSINNTNSISSNTNNVCAGNANSDNNMSSGNDVMNLLNNYVLNPVHFSCNSTYLSEQNNCYSHQQNNPHFISNSVNYPAEPNYAGTNYVNHQCNSHNDTNETNESHQSLPNSLIVSIAVSVAGKSEPIFFQGHAGNFSSESYKNNVLSHILPFIKTKTPEFCFIHDRSTAFRSQNTVRFLEENAHDFVRPNEWPSKCPQLNPVDYFVWKKLQKSVYKGEPIKDIRQLKERIISCWNDIGQKSVNTAIYQWMGKLRAAINNAKD